MLLALVLLVWLVEGGLVSCDAKELFSGIVDVVGRPL